MLSSTSVRRGKPVRVPGTAVFMTSDTERRAAVLLHHLKHNKVLHEQVILLSVLADGIPEVAAHERATITPLGHGFYRVIARFGFMQTPNVREVLGCFARAGIKVRPGDTSYFLGRETAHPHRQREDADVAQEAVRLPVAQRAAGHRVLRPPAQPRRRARRADRVLMRGAAAALLLAALVGVARAQEPDPHAAQPERPTVATHAFTIAPGWTELESGLEFDRLNDSHLFQTPTTLKLGLASHLQVEFTAAYVRATDATTASGMSDLSVALKWRPSDSLPLLGAFAIQPAVRLYTGAAGITDRATLGTMLFISSHVFGRVSMDLNLGVTARLSAGGDVPPTALSWAASTGFPIAGSLGWTAEFFGYPGTSGANGSAPLVGFLTGPTYTVRPWLVLDLGVILPVDGQQARAVYTGLTWNIRAGLAD